MRSLAACGRRRRDISMKGWHCIVCLCEWCGCDNHKVLLSNYHICQSTAIGCVGGREIPCGADCVITVSWESYSQAQVCFVCWVKTEGNSVGPVSSVLSWLTEVIPVVSGVSYNYWSYKNLPRKRLFFSLVSNPGSCLHLQKCASSKKASAVAGQSCHSFHVAAANRCSTFKGLELYEEKQTQGALVKNSVRVLLEKPGKFAFW